MFVRPQSQQLCREATCHRQERYARHTIRSLTQRQRVRPGLGFAQLSSQADTIGKFRAKTKGEGGQAMEQRDATKSTERAKKEHPEAPDTVIGMQDERGGKGH